jgi:thiol-disulfide isomerase/thioredoxin
MKLHLTALLLLMAAGTHAETRLRWNNGESILGEMVEASAETLKWKSPLFKDPIELQWQALRRIDQPLRPTAVPDPFTLSLRDGSQIHGDVMEVTEHTIRIKSDRHGDVVLKRSEVLSVRRLKGGNLIWAGPLGDVNWSNLADRGDKSGKPIPPPGMPRLTGGPGGALVLPFWDRGALFSEELPPSLDLEFRVRSSCRPEFKLSLECAAKHTLDIDTWDDEIVLTMTGHSPFIRKMAAEGVTLGSKPPETQVNDFQLIRKLAEADREVGMRLCWDKKTRVCHVFSAAGELLTEWRTPPVPGGGNPKLVLRNKGRDLSLEFLRVRQWDGKPPPKVDVTQPRIEMADGTVVAGKVIRAAAGKLYLISNGQEAEQEVSLASVDALILSNDRPAPANATLAFADGTYVMGSITSIKDGAAVLKTAFTEAPLAMYLTDLRRLRQNFKAVADGAVPEKPLNELDKIVIDDITLHGTLVASNAEQPLWRLIGGATDAVLTGQPRLEISRAFPGDAKLPAASALFYTTAGDVLPGTLVTLDKSGVEYESDIMALKKLSAESLDAIQFNADARMNVTGFTGPGWSIVKGDEKTVVREQNKLRMQPDSSIRHSDVMQAGEIKFTFSFDGYSSVRLRLFCAGTDGAGTTNVILYLSGDTVYSGREITEGQMNEQIRTPVQNNKPLSVRLVVQTKFVEMYLNGLLAHKFPIAASMRPGPGLIIEPASVWGNRPTAITVNDFSARSQPGQARLPNVDAEIRRQTLTVPRFRRDDPPRHVIIAANGDVLRGEIESMTPSHFKFRSGLESFTVPRERVKAAMWLKPPLKDAPPPAQKSQIAKMLDQRVQRRVRYSNGSMRTLTSALLREAPGLQIELPKNPDTRTLSFQFGDQTVGEALEEICKLFALSYRIKGNTSIILETAPTLPKNLVTKSWWLSPDAFAKSDSAQKILEGKGLVFPAGASATWDPVARLLSVTNTIESQDKIAEVLKTDLGGSHGSPTYWLLLSNGARLGLTIDKFEKDFILGHHPIYGACKIPNSQVYMIRNRPLEPVATAGPVQSWQLVFAAEPVLPESGGQASPLLGKEARAFKLPLLGGGDFALGAERGNVVVLDFWATWCAPCIRALPELIDTTSAFPADRVKFIAVNQDEPDEQVKRFLETRGWKLQVAMDAGQKIGRLYGVESLPHTVIIGPDGTVVWVKTGYSPSGANEVKEAILKLLAKPEDKSAKEKK